MLQYITEYLLILEYITLKLFSSIQNYLQTCPYDRDREFCCMERLEQEKHY